MNNGAHWGLYYGVRHVGITALTTDGIEPITVRKTEGGKAHQGWHEVSTTMATRVDIRPLFGFL